MGHRVSSSELAVGQPLPWNTFDANGTLLLRRGFVIDTQRAIERLVEEGLFVADKDPRGGRQAPEPEPETPSALQFLLDARRLLDLPAQDPKAASDFPLRIARAVQFVEQACRLHGGVALASVLLEHEHGYAVRHAVDTAVVGCLMAQAIQMPPDKARSLVAAALTMNLSMLEIQDRLNEVKGPLNEKLRTLIGGHPLQSVQLLAKLGIDDPVWLRYVEQHHECENGAGYPHGLAGTQIEEGAKIIALADRFCAQVTWRGYRPMRPPGEVLKDLYLKKGAEINPVIAAYLVRVVGVYPPGTLVRLRSGEIGVVVEATDDANTPIIYALLGPNGAALAVPVRRRTTREDFGITDVLTLDKIECPIQMSRLWGDAARIC